MSGVHRLPTPDFLVKRIKNLERQVRLLQGKRTLENSSIGAGGLTIEDGGALQMETPEGVFVVSAGQTTIPDGSGRLQQAFALAYDTGEVALALADLGTVPGHPHKQSFQVFDSSGNIVLAPDADGNGLARPHLTLGPLLPTDSAKWAGGFATSWTTISNCYVEKQNPILAWTIQIFSPAATTTQFRLLLGGTQIGTTQTITNTITTWQESQAIPASIGFGAVALLELQVQATSGTGAAGAQQVLLQGLQA